MSQTNVEWPLPYPDALGPLIGADDVADAVEATLAEWSPFYVGAISARVQGAGKIGGRNEVNAPLKPFGQWVNEPQYRSVGAGTPAAYQVRALATVGEPERKGTGLYIATWRTQVTLQYFGTTWRQARDGTSWYEKAVRWCITQHKSLGGFAMSTKWMGTAYSGETHSATRTLGVATLAFDVKVANVLDDTRGPRTVPLPPLVPEMDPTVEDVLVTVANVGPTGDLATAFEED